MWLAGNAKIEFDAKRRDVNSKLQKQHCAPLCDEEVWGTRDAKSNLDASTSSIS